MPKTIESLPPLQRGRLVRPKIAQQYLGISNSQFYDLIRRKLLPPMRKLGPRTSAMLSDDLMEVIQNGIKKEVQA